MVIKSYVIEMSFNFFLSKYSNNFIAAYSAHLDIHLDEIINDEKLGF